MSTRADRKEAHKVKMAAKKVRRKEDTFASNDHIFANLSVNHPNWGMTPVENERRMQEKVVDKSA